MLLGQPYRPSSEGEHRVSQFRQISCQRKANKKLCYDKKEKKNPEIKQEDGIARTVFRGGEKYNLQRMQA